jgi:hypothetical protein
MKHIFLKGSSVTKLNKIIKQDISINDSYYTGVPQIERVVTEFESMNKTLFEILTFHKPEADDFFYLGTKQIYNKDQQALMLETYHVNGSIYERVHYAKGIAQYVQIYNDQGDLSGSIHLYDSKVVYVIDNKQVSEYDFWNLSCEEFQNNTYDYCFTGANCLQYKN